MSAWRLRLRSDGASHVRLAQWREEVKRWLGIKAPSLRVPPELRELSFAVKGGHGAVDACRRCVDEAPAPTWSAPWSPLRPWRSPDPPLTVTLASRRSVTSHGPLTLPHCPAKAGPCSPPAPRAAHNSGLQVRCSCNRAESRGFCFRAFLQL